MLLCCIPCFLLINLRFIRGCIRTINTNPWLFLLYQLNIFPFTFAFVNYTVIYKTKVERKDIELVDEEEPQIGADCSSVTSNKYEIYKEEARNAAQKHKAKRVESVSVDVEAFGDHWKVVRTRTHTTYLRLTIRQTFTREKEESPTMKDENEFKHVTVETDRLQKKKGKVDSTVQNLNFKILRAKSKLEPVSAAEEKARFIVMSKNRITIFSTKLKTLTESTMRERALTAQHSSMITISKFEYEYLTNHAASVEEIIDKKVAAVEAWIEALKASVKEILMETKIAQRELKESKL
ncbi:hypothetical protein JHK84_027773 [Glycine max]|nr:hypothetical protein JHK84_027773 [Glycine max]